MPRASSLDAGHALGPVHEQQHLGVPSRLQYSSTAGGASPVAAGGAMRRTATVSGHGELLAQSAQQHKRSSSPSAAVSAPGLDLAMYRAAGRLLPLNLNYMPNTLTK